MDKFEYKVHAEEIKSLIREGEFEEAAAIADTIDWRRVKSVMMLCTVSDVYKINRRFEESKEILLLAYERHPSDRRIVFSLCELSIKLGEYVQAIEYYKEYVQVSPKDNDRFILQYKIYESQDVSLEERIAVLEEFKRRDYREKWAYELAYLYHRVGLTAKCVEECDEMSLWFGEGRYVSKALELKKVHMPLTEEQAVKLEKQKKNIKKDEYLSDDDEVAAIDEDALVNEWDEEADEQADYEAEEYPTREYPSVSSGAVAKEADELDIRIKPVDVSQYNTINLQQELAESMKEILLEPAEEKVSTEVYFEDTSDIPMETYAEMPEKMPAEEAVPEQMSFKAQITPKANEKSPLSNTGIIKTFIKPSNYDEILSQEYDGQISLVVPEEQKLEKQITGQIKIEDVLAEWERQKKEIEQKRMAEVRSRVRKQTDTLFSDFDEATKSGLLEKLEKAMLAAVIKEEEEKSRNSAPNVVKVSDIRSPKTRKQPEEIDQEVQKLLDMDYEPEDEEITEEQAKETAEAEENAEAEIAEEVKQPEADIAKETTEAEEDHPKQEEETEETAESAQSGSHDRELSDSEKKLFGRFVHHKKTRRQLIGVLENISMAAYTGNVIITGEEGIAAIEVAKGLIKEVQQTDSNFSGKVAKISGETLNKKDVAATISKVVNGAVIIEKASKMNTETAKNLMKSLEQENTGLIVILEDIKSSMNKLIEDNAGLENAFNLRVDLEALDDQSLVAFAKKYAAEMEYTIDDFGVLALHTRIADMQTSDHEVTVAEVQEIIDEAIYYADKKNPKHFFDILVGKRYDEEDMIILGEKDFMHY